MKTPLDILLPYQRDYVDDAARFKLWLASRQVGKSFAASMEAVLDSLKNPGSMWVILSAGERQALEFMEKAKQNARAFKLAVENYTEDRETANAIIKSASIEWANGSRMIALPANPNTARGYSANLILDEFAFHDNPDLIWRGIYPSISNPLRGKFKLRVVSTANGKNNRFYKLWEKEDSRYSKHLTTIHDAVAGGLCMDEDPEAFIRELREGLDDDEGWEQEFECKFVDGSYTLLPYDLILPCESINARSVVPFGFWGSKSFRHPIYCGVDFGRTNDPTVCWSAEEIEGKLVTTEILVLKKMSTPDQVRFLRERVAACQRMCLDYTGPGVGLGDYLAEEFGRYEENDNGIVISPGKVELCTFTPGLKRSIFPKFRAAFEAPARLFIPSDIELREDLHAMQQIVHNSEYNYLAPRTKEGHSDRCTAGALMLRAAGDKTKAFAFQSLNEVFGMNRRQVLNARFNRRTLI